ncbi:RNA polymerase, sigma-24 subunit, ECF subfamily [Paenibacillus curdlanolyticus YK9]|uniref:RNA polymerase, sigma-24 subunit, ECF subfamily n=1 Tax=Paenibacillus curdlanolyticus YK9 TaxID=717606 RepID=E0IBS4_9BACL|nr:sigma factor-like helix-turn-helix DNA-binding protein [Paenibacillus curdlanolyticus]EFM10154.1 RNA polymerase, sigma-24 subunit, ECF subfamily [Paenibacillus curdlanolyticus YK9]
MDETAVIEQLSNYKRIVARIKVLENYSIGAGITVSRLNQDDQLMELHRKLRGMPTYMYLSKREQELETTAHAYLDKYPSGIRSQLRAIPAQGCDADDDKALRELRAKIEKVIEARTGSKDGYEAVIERLSELQDLQAQRDQIDAALEALESYKPDYAKLLRLRYVEGVPVQEAAAEMKIAERTFRSWRTKALEEFERLAV